MSLTLPELEPAERRAGAPAGARPRPRRSSRALAAAPHAFEFYQVMRLLEALHPDRPRFGRSTRPAQDLLRLAQEPSVTHAPASLAGYEPGEDGRPDRLLVHFFGLFGTDGPLPLHLTEYARDRRRNHARPDLRAASSTCSTTGRSRCSTAPGPTSAPRSASTGRSRTASATTWPP